MAAIIIVKFQNLTRHSMIEFLLRIIAAHCVLLSALPAYGKPKDKIEPDSLHWKMVAKKFSEGRRFYSNIDFGKSSNLLEYEDTAKYLDTNANYIFQNNGPLVIKLSKSTIAGSSLQEVKIKVAKCLKDSWLDSSTIVTNVEPDETRLLHNTGEQGFFRVKLTTKAQDSNLDHPDAYFLVCDNWKKDILTFCCEMKQEIESGLDPQLVFSSIVVSHFDHMLWSWHDELDQVLVTTKKKYSKQRWGQWATRAIRKQLGADIGFLLPLLKEYFTKNPGIDMDAELNRNHLNIF